MRAKLLSRSCKHLARRATFAASLGARHKAPLHPAAQGYAWNTAPYGYPGSSFCTGPTCKAFAVIECVSAGAEPLLPDARGNIGCGCSGWGNVGNW